MPVEILMSCTGCCRVGFVDTKLVGRSALFCGVCRKPLTATPKAIVESVRRRQGVVAS